MEKVLIIDDDEQICNFLSDSFQGVTTSVDYALSLSDGISQLSLNNIDVLFLDVNLPDGNGIEAVHSIQRLESPPEIIIMTADSDPDGAELAMKLNVWDYIPKTVSHKTFVLSLTRALAFRRQKKARVEQKTEIKRGGIIGKSDAISKCMGKIARAARGDMPVLITGDTGTGKELFARAIHINSERKNREFVVVDCAALPDHLVEGILFGHKKGAFTGADYDKTGLLEMADKGTLFLDELGEMPMDIQKKFLRALQEKKVRPLGSKKEVETNFRLIAATHQDIEAMTGQGKFRKDLYFRIFSIRIKLPPLQDRQEDIPLIAREHIKFKNELLEKEAFRMSDEFVRELSVYNWPGNVRELKNAIDSACSRVLHGEMLFPQHLPEHIRSYNIRKKISRPKNSGGTITSPEEIIPLKAHIDNTKNEYLQRLLAVTGKDIKSCCRLSGLSRGHLYNLFKKYRIKL